MAQPIAELARRAIFLPEWIQASSGRYSTPSGPCQIRASKNLQNRVGAAVRGYRLRCRLSKGPETPAEDRALLNRVGRWSGCLLADLGR